MSLGKRLRTLLGGAPPAKPKVPAKKGPVSIADSPRAKLIAEAQLIHKSVGTQMRAQITNTIADLQRGGTKTLRDPAALERLMSLLKARQTMNWLMRHDLRRYLVLTGVRQWKGEGAEAPPLAATPKARVVRR